MNIRHEDDGAGDVVLLFAAVNSYLNNGDRGGSGGEW